MRARVWQVWLSAAVLIVLTVAVSGIAFGEVDDGTTPLHWAAHNNDADAVDELLMPREIPRPT